MLGSRYLIIVGLMVASMTLSATEDESSEIIKSSLVRIGFCKMAYVQQTKAMTLCRAKLKEVEDTYKVAVDNPDEDQDVAYYQYDTDKKKLNSLLKTYLNQTVSTMKILSSESQTMALAQVQLGQYNYAYETMVESSVQWDQIASIYEGYADSYQKAFEYKKAGSAYETAFSAYETARKKWLKTLSYAKTDGRKSEAKGHVEECSLSSIRVLETAASSYLTSSQRHVEAAGDGVIDIYATNAGNEWITAANMHRKHEQISKKIKQLEVARGK